ncbi:MULTISPECIES: helix-turn-helix domain-containing protein [unclassified Burkholderia]|uniref:IclR family transcriptional regulator n=1 Tax=unclassified Burkholderia TaxID=2613784 RepID=UPI00196570A2|nr:MULTISPECIES: helix-turn-helix domain-containing protein [unclassified Burkholderia]
MERGGKAIQSVQRAMALLEALSAQGGSARLMEIAAATGLSKSTAHGVLDTLVEMGYVTRERHRYALGLRLAATVRPLLPQGARLREAFVPALRAFNALCGENCFLAVPCGTRAYLTLDALDGEGRALDQPVNERRDALTTSAIGKIFLAHTPALARRLRQAGALPAALDSELPTIGEQGFAFDLQASQARLNCFALPLRLRGRMVAALGASGPADRLDPSLMRHLARRSMRELFDLVKC